MSGRLLAIGDIHGCSTALSTLVDALNPGLHDTVVTLGDYVGKGVDSRGVLDFLITLGDHCRLVPLLGNHDLMMRAAIDGSLNQRAWAMFGADDILTSYGVDRRIEGVPIAHREFLHSCMLFHETDSHIFVHASYAADRPLAETDEATLLWEHIGEDLPARHQSGKSAIVGHTSQKNGNVLDAGHFVCIDTNCWAGRWLTGMEVESRSIIQVDKEGNFRS